MNEMKCGPSSILTFIFVLFCPQFGSFEECNCRVDPEQIHLSIGNLENEFFVTWVTFCTTEKSIVWFGTASEGLTSAAEGCCSAFVDGGNAKVVRYIHRVSLRGLKPDTYYSK